MTDHDRYEAMLKFTRYEAMLKFMGAAVEATLALSLVDKATVTLMPRSPNLSCPIALPDELARLNRAVQAMNEALGQWIGEPEKRP